MDLWKEPDTILHNIIATPTENKSGQQYNVYFASEAELGRPHRIKAMTTSGRYRDLVGLSSPRHSQVCVVISEVSYLKCHT